MKPKSYRLFQSSPVAITGIASLLAISAARAVNSEKDVAAGATNLSLATAYDPAATSTATSDVTFLKYVLPLGDPPVPMIYTNATTLVITANVAMGTLNSLNANPLVIGNTSGSGRSITLNGGGNTVSVVNGGDAADLIFLANDTNLSVFKSGSEMDVTLATSGNFNVSTGAALTINSRLRGPFNLTKTGGGILTVGGSTSDLAGTFTVAAGTVKVAGARGFGAAANNVSVSSGAVVDLNGINYNTANPLALNGTGISSGGALTNSNASLGTYSGIVTMASDTSIGGNNGDITLTNIVAGNFNLTKTGSNTLTLNKNTDHTFGSASTTFSVASGTVKLGQTQKVLGDDANKVSVSSGGALDLNGRNSTAVNALILNGTGISSGGALTNSSSSTGTYPGLVTLGSSAVSIGGTGLINLTNAGSITGTDYNLTLRGGGGTITSIVDTGAGSVTVNATGTWTLNGVNTYSGGTNITGGTLRVGGSTGSVSVTSGMLLVNGTTAAVSIAAAGTVGGSGGTVSGAVSMVSGSTVAPGTTTSIGTLNTTGNVGFVSGAVFDVDINTNSTTTDLLNVDGNLDLAGATLVPANLGLAYPASLAVFTIATYTGTLSGTFAGLPEGATVMIAGKAYTLKYADGFGENNITLTAPLATPYESWATTNISNINPAADPTPQGDPDKDSFSNLAEFAFNGNPSSGSNSGQIHVLTEDSDFDSPDTAKELILTVAVRSGAPAFAGSPSPVSAVDGITYTIQGSTTLGSFGTAVNVVPTPVITNLPAAGDGYEYRSFSLEGSNNLADKGFLRAKVTN